METVTIELKNEHARRLLEDLQLLGTITILSSSSTVQRPPATYNAVSVSTKGFKFNREEANER